MKISSAEGIGFAVPINVVKPVIYSFNNNNSFEQATIGVYAYDKEVIPYLNSNISFNKGIYVSQIVKNEALDLLEKCKNYETLDLDNPVDAEIYKICKKRKFTANF